jgi:hypothetical protein
MTPKKFYMIDSAFKSPEFSSKDLLSESTYFKLETIL